MCKIFPRADVLSCCPTPARQPCRGIWVRLRGRQEQGMIGWWMCPNGLVGNDGILMEGRWEPSEPKGWERILKRRRGAPDQDCATGHKRAGRWPESGSATGYKSGPFSNSLSTSSNCTISQASLSVGVTFISSRKPSSSRYFSTSGVSSQITKEALLS